MNKKIRIIIVDDHDITLHGMGTFISSLDNTELIAQVDSGEKVLKELENNEVDIVVSDLDMPNMDGLELMNHIHKRFPTVKVLICTMHFNGWILKKLIKNNVDGIITKDNVLVDLQKALDYLMDGNMYLSKEISNIINIRTNSHEPESKYFDIKLSRREKEILAHIADEKTTNQIAETLGLSINTVESHRHNLFLKFDVKNSIGLIKKAFEREMLEL